MTDIDLGRTGAPALWQGLGRLVAAGAGAAGALLALGHGAALDVACLRGGAIALVALLVTRLGDLLLARAASRPAKETTGPAPRHPR